MQRGPDDGGLGWWTGQVASSGRVNVCNAFEASSEFATLVATLYGTAASDKEVVDVTDASIGSSKEASAQEPSSPVARPGPDPTDPAMPLTPDERLVVDPVVAGAIDLMKPGSQCYNYIRGFSLFDPRVVLSDLNRSNGITHWDTNEGHADTLRPGAGSGSTIRLHNQFFDKTVGGLTLGGKNGVFSRNPTPFEAREMVMLHETKHATTGIPHSKTESSTKWCDRIFNYCIR